MWVSRPVRQLNGRVQAPGDKSCSHRALMFAGIANGNSEISGLLTGDDVLRTGQVMVQMGARVTRVGNDLWKVEGVGKAGLKSPQDVLDFGNSGTGSRLILGLASGYDLVAKFDGDVSLRSRPMNRVLDPLRQMGIGVTASEGGRLPLTLEGRSNLQAIEYAPMQASAQVKSAILLAGLNADGTTIVRESRFTRDHTEKMLRGFGVEVSSEEVDGAHVASIVGGQTLQAQNFQVPGDPSSAAFLVAAGLISPNGDVVIDNIMTNPTRTGFIEVAWGMGPLALERTGEVGGEAVMSITAKGSGEVRPAAPNEAQVPSMIDEFPILAVLASFAKGETQVTGAEELRVKESDRISAIVNMLRVNGVGIEESEDGFVIEGCDGPPPGGGVVETRHDHRIAMSALIMGTAAQKPVAVDDISMIDTSYPDFLSHMRSLGADISEGDVS